MNIPRNLKYTKTHEWVEMLVGKAKVGITDFAQQEISDIVHIELPEVGKIVKKEQPVAVVESVKSAFDIYAPLSGKIIEINDAILDSPEIVNQSTYEKGFLFIIEIADAKEMETLLSSDDYQKLI
ncbi:MAG: glycine cleavage system protein GcvH [Elusimicrobiota bacterium]|jgi:glycine cleavage system H protein|nr:glycine cleavage system protein GcvH [Elusimicrobiota bacterium]